MHFGQRQQILAIVLLPAFLSVVLLVVFLRSSLHDWALERWTNDHRAFVSTLESRIDADIAQAAGLIRFAARSPTFLALPELARIDRAINGLPEHLDPDKRLLLEQLRVQGRFSVVFVLTPSGDHYISHPFRVQQALKKYSLADRPYFQAARSTRDLVISDSFVGADGIPAVAMDMPVIDADGKIVLHLGGVLHLSHLSSLLEPAGIAPFDHAVIVDRLGKTVAASDPASLGPTPTAALLAHPAFAGIAGGDQAVASGGDHRAVRVVRSIDANGVEWLNFDIRTNPGWHLFLFRRLDHLQSEIAPQVQSATMLAVGILLLPGLLALFLALRFSQRWQRADAALRDMNATLEARVAERTVELQRSETRHRTLFESTADAVLILNHGKFLDCNPAALRIFGARSRDDLLLRSPQDISPAIQLNGEDTGAAANRHLAQALAQGSCVFEWMHLRVDNGLPFFAEVLLSRMDTDGEVLIQATVRDISERKRTEAALRASEERFRSLTKLGADWYWETDEHFRFTEISGGERFQDTFGQLDLIGRTLWEMASLDADEVFRAPHQARHERYEPYRDVEFRRVDHSGRIVTISVSGEPKFDDAGRFTGYRGIGSDITEKKQTREALNIASLVYSNSVEAMVVTDANDLIISVNAAFEQTTGYTAAEVIGKNPSMFKSGRQDPAFYENMWQVIKATGQWRGQMWNRRKSGDIYLEQVSINTVFNPDGSVRKRVALFSDITKTKEAEELIWRQANFDSLTALPNRGMLRDRLAQELKKTQRTHQQLALLLIDLDRFKEVNETLGHSMGDSLLIDAALRISGCVRGADTVARLGGDEFAVLLTEAVDVGSIERVAFDILQRLTEPFSLGVNPVVISASIGIALYPADATDVEALLKSADQAMYVAKKQGRNRFSYFTPSLQESAQQRMRLVNDLRGATEGGQLRTYFQPIVDLANGRIHKAEALVRWQHPQLGLVSPAEFIPLAEETGLIFEIGDFVFKESARWAQRWRSSHDKDFQISVNKSPIQFHRHSVADNWLLHLRDIDLPGSAIVIEITEGLLLASEAPIMECLLGYRDHGVQVSIDDFGTGYSSLSYLKKFHIDYLKIDQSFVRNLAPGSSDMALSEAIIVMAHKLGLKVIAEGVETGEQRDLLLAAGCDYGQGYLFSRPLPPEDFEKLLQI